LKAFLDRERVRQEWIETLPPRKNLFRKLADLRDRKVDLVFAVGGDGTLLQAAHRFRGSGLPILGINIGYLGFITSVRGNRVRKEMKRVLNAEFILSHPSGEASKDKRHARIVQIKFRFESCFHRLLSRLDGRELPAIE
jgi:NAD kinase